MFRIHTCSLSLEKRMQEEGGKSHKWNEESAAFFIDTFTACNNNCNLIVFCVQGGKNKPFKSKLESPGKPLCIEATCANTLDLRE